VGGELADHFALPDDLQLVQQCGEVSQAGPPDRSHDQADQLPEEMIVRRRPEGSMPPDVFEVSRQLPLPEPSELRPSTALNATGRAEQRVDPGHLNETHPGLECTGPVPATV